MKNASKNKKRIIDKILCGFCIILITLCAYAVSHASQPNEINVSNITNAEAVISWVTDIETNGSIVYGTDPGNLTVTAHDKRGPSSVYRTQPIYISFTRTFFGLEFSGKHSGAIKSRSYMSNDK